MTQGFPSRRETLAGLSVSTLALGSHPAVAAQAQPDPVFRHGVASGDPDATSLVLWTRVTAREPVEVEWELAHDAAFRRTIQAGLVWTGPDRDFTVKVLVSGLQPGGRYHYRFRALGETSPVGRTLTLPTGRLDRLGLALVSCSNFTFGFFNAYAAIARDAAVDVVLHTGDYIYEYAADGWGAETARRIGRVHEPAGEIVTLSDYRIRHAQYKTDAGSRAMLAAKPLLCCWDDHESANNPWTDGAENHQPATEGDWANRREAALQAYYEWMPIRDPAPGRTRAQFWRTYVFGDLATLSTLETRHTARALQVDYADWRDRVSSRQEAEALERETIGAPGRRLIGPDQEADLEAAWRASVAAGQPWRLIGNPMPIARTRVPDVAALGLVPDLSNPAAAVLAWKGRWNLPFYPDTWDGYAWARERFYAVAREAGATDLVFLTGDSHSFWANRLADAEGRPAGVEIGTAGVTSPGDFIESGFDPVLAGRLDQAFMDHNPEVLWTDNLHQGYVRLELSRTEGLVTFLSTPGLDRPDARAEVVRRWGLEKGPRGLDLAPV
ncbi:MAG: alkaline phosphatase D family protein [Phenylobacterium sp.]|uniref:alkaline phosphatase D family protein n=1 Tax=Phenylobacterium sp. TaxID=1871053 RepID=UPI0025F16E8D|nr:alkaline phosphatase D family protein [Phenylobacterium sp.]MCA3709786.1 alkaline phosphatase D family protein [Phenylobacterium sp.]